MVLVQMNGIQIRESYRDLVKVWHPDRFAHDPKLQQKAEEKLKEINLAYQAILDYLKNLDKNYYLVCIYLNLDGMFYHPSILPIFPDILRY